MANAARIFVSHSSEDTEWCRTFVGLLRQAGADVWYDKDNVGIGVLRDVIAQEMILRPIFIVILSPNAVAKAWVRDEVGVAINLWHKEPERIILPVVAHKCLVPEFWKLFTRVSGEGDTGIDPVEAAQRVIAMLALGTTSAATDSADRAWEMGKALQAQRRFREALIAYERAIHLAPAVPSYWISKGNLLLDMKWPQEALQALDHALTLDPQSMHAWVGKGRSLRRLGLTEQALQAYDQALALEPDLTAALVGRADIFIDRDNQEQALHAYENALESDPSFASAWAGKAKVFRNLGRFDQALIAYERALICDPRLSAAWNGKIISLLRLGRSEEALEARRQRDKLTVSDLDE